MKTIKNIKPDRRITNHDLIALVKENPICAGEPRLVGRGKTEHVVFPQTQNGRYLVSVKCKKKVKIYLGELPPSGFCRALLDELSANITYWADMAKRRALFDQVSMVTDELKEMLC